MTDANAADDDRFAKLLEDYHSAYLVNDAENFWNQQSCSLELRRRVERAHDGLRQLDSFLKRSSSDHAGTADQDLKEWLSVPTQLDRFQIVRELGRGGFGVVYLAKDTALHREVAIKVPRFENLAAASLQNRFTKEAEIAASLDHPHIVPVFEVGRVGRGIYIVSLYCPGTNLAQRLVDHAGELTIAQIVELMICISKAMAYCHGRSVLHRDLKPANVLLFPAAYGSLGFLPRINDFGLAKILEASVSDTASSAMLGTPLYMSPEQVSSQFDKIGPATDVYGLGTILYELLTGQPPFSGTVADLLDQIRMLDPTKPRELNRDIPFDLETICLKCLSKQVSERYSDAGGLLADLSAFHAGTPISARRPTPLQQIQRWLVRVPNQVFFGAILPTVCVLIGLIGFALTRLYLNTADPGSSQTAAVEPLARPDLNARYVQNAHYLRMGHDCLKLGKQYETLEHLTTCEGLISNEVSRSFPWYYLNYRANTTGSKLSGLSAEALSADFSPDGRWIVGGDRLGNVCIWSETGELVKTFNYSNKEVNAVKFSPDGKLLATGGQGSRIHVWQSQTWEPLCVLSEFQGTINGLAWSPDSSRVVCGSRQNRVSIWDIASNTRQKILRPVNDTVRDVAWSADGRFIAAVAGPHIVLWGAESQELKKEITIAGPHGLLGDAESPELNKKVITTYSELHCLTFSPDSKRLLAAGFSQKLIFVNMDDLDQVIEVPASGPVRDVDWSTDGRHITGALSFGGPRIWSSELLTEESTLDRSFTRVTRFSPDRSRLLSSELESSELTLWSLSSAMGYSEVASADPTLAWDFSNDRLAYVTSGTTTNVWDADQARSIFELPGKTSCATLNSLAGMLAREQPGIIEVWDLKTKSLKASLPKPGFGIQQMELSADGRRLYVSSYKDDWALYDIVASALMIEQKADLLYSPSAHTFSPDGQSMVLRKFPSGGNINFELRDVRNGQKVCELNMDITVRAIVSDASFSKLYVADNDGIHVYNVATKTFDSGDFRLRRRVQRLALSPDGLTLAAWIADEGLFLWDVRTGQELFPILQTRAPIDQLKFVSNTQLVCRHQHASGHRLVLFKCAPLSTP